MAKILDKIRAEVDVENPMVPVGPPLEMRIFTNQSGQMIEAGLIDVTATSVVIQRADGKKFTSMVNIYSQTDQDYIRNWVISKLDASGIRIFTDQEGRTIEAGIIDVIADTVIIQRIDGRKFVSKITIYSDEDQGYIRNWTPESEMSSDVFAPEKVPPPESVPPPEKVPPPDIFTPKTVPPPENEI